MKIYFTAEYDPREIGPLQELGTVEIDGWAKGLPKLTEEELIARTADADIIVTTFDDITRGVIENAKNLKLIACTRATPVNIDIAAAKERNIPVLFTPGRNSDATAEHTIGLMLSIARKIPMAHAALKAGEYTAPPETEYVTKEGLRPANCVGVADSDYRGEYIVALHNDSNAPRTVKHGDRIAQLVILPVILPEFNEVDSLNDTIRGEGGFGSTGV